MRLILAPTGAFKAIRAARLREWRGEAVVWREGADAQARSEAVLGYSTLSLLAIEPGAAPLSLSPSEEKSAYRGVAARIWNDPQGRAVHLAVVRCDIGAGILTAERARRLDEIAEALAELSPERVASLRDAPTLEAAS